MDARNFGIHGSNILFGGMSLVFKRWNQVSNQTTYVVIQVPSVPVVATGECKAGSCEGNGEDNLKRHNDSHKKALLQKQNNRAKQTVPIT
jgi:hypothetical protein